MTAAGFLRYGRVECLPLVHGRLAFATLARRRLLEDRFDAVAVELPPSLRPQLLEGLELLPSVSVVLYREQPDFLDPGAPAWYVPVQPGDGIIEALRVARSERLPSHFVDAEVEGFVGRPVVLPDSHAAPGMGIGEYYHACRPVLARHPRTAEDELRESHMARRLADLQGRYTGQILFLCGMAHWEGVRRHLVRGTGTLSEGTGPAPEQVRLLRPHGRSLPFLMGEMPFLVEAYERHRAGIDLEDFDPGAALKELLLEARATLIRDFPESLEEAGPQGLRGVLDFTRKLTVRRGYLYPSSYHLVVAAKGMVGNDFALSVLDLAHRYRWQDDPGADDGGREGSDPVAMNDRSAVLGDEAVEARSRVPGVAFEYGRLQLERVPDARRRKEWLSGWDPGLQCSWPPEDLVIENFRDYIGRRALSLARVALARVEPFTASLLDGIDFRETLRDLTQGKIWVRDEPPVPGAVGALVLIFDEDEFGERFPWRATWLAEHHNESTLAFYATDFRDSLIGPGIARASYGGCMLVYPPRSVPDIWHDLRFERARRPSERLLLAALYYSEDRFVVHVAKQPPSHGVRREARRRNKHILHLPLSTFSRRTLERVRRFHVLNGQHVRSYAQRFVR